MPYTTLLPVTSWAKAFLGTLSHGLSNWFSGNAAYIFSLVTVKLPLYFELELDPTDSHSSSLALTVSNMYITFESSCTINLSEQHLLACREKQNPSGQ